MKTLAAFTLVVLSCVPAMAQFGGTEGMGAARQPQKVSLDVEFLEMEQDADKAALKEALLLQARQGMKPARVTQPEKERFEEEAAALRSFIEKTKEAIIARSAELAKTRVAKAAPAGQPPKFDRKAAIEESEKAQVEARLLRAKLGHLEEPLAKAIKELAEAEFAAGNDEARCGKAATARREYDKIKARHVELSTELRLEEQQAGGMGVMSRGFR